VGRYKKKCDQNKSDTNLADSVVGTKVKKRWWRKAGVQNRSKIQKRGNHQKTKRENVKAGQTFPKSKTRMGKKPAKKLGSKTRKKGKAGTHSAWGKMRSTSGKKVHDWGLDGPFLEKRENIQRNTGGVVLRRRGTKNAGRRKRAGTASKKTKGGIANKRKSITKRGHRVVYTWGPRGRF